MLSILQHMVSSLRVVVAPHLAVKPVERGKRWYANRSGYLLAFFLLSASALPSSAEEQIIAGWLEKAKIYPGGLLIHAKLDTGAKTTSLSIRKLQKFEKDGELWVRFQVVSRKERARTFERKVMRKVKIKRHSLQPLERYVVKLGVCVGNYFKEAEVNLADRSNFNYEMLIGRTFLAPHTIVDSSKTYTLQLDCKHTSKP
jgi:hypothetical protein